MNSDQLSKSIRSLIEAAADAGKALSARSGLSIEYAHIQDALMEVMELDSAEELLDRELSAAGIVAILENYDFHRLFPKQIAVIHFEDSIIPDRTSRKLIEVTVRANGEVWRIHQNDADPRPSNPHGHNLESGLKLHLGTGELFQGTRNTGEKVRRKHLEAIRAKLSKYALPPLAL
jgi:hypothetical protein